MTVMCLCAVSLSCTTAASSSTVAGPAWLDRNRPLAITRLGLGCIQQIVQETKGLHTTDPDPVSVQTAVSHIFLSQIAELIPITLNRMPRVSERDPSGMRAEHWYDFGKQAGDSNMFVQVVAHIAAASVPQSVLRYLTAGQITPLAKPTGGHRPPLMMSVLRRVALKSVMAAKKESVAKCAALMVPTP